MIDSASSPGGSPRVPLPASVRREADAAEHSAPWWSAEKPPSDRSQSDSTAPHSAVRPVAEPPSAEKHRGRQDDVW